MKKILVVFMVLLFPSISFSEMQTFVSGDGLVEVRTKLLGNAAELYVKIITGGTLTGTLLTLTFDDDTNFNVDLSGLQGGIGTDDQTITDLSLLGNVLSISLENGNTVTQDLSTIVGSGGLADAPDDGTTYARQSETWVPVAGSLPTVKYVRQLDSGTADGSSYANAWGVDSIDYATIAELGTLYICGEIQGSIVPTKGLHVSGACPGYPGILNGSVDYVGGTWTEDGTNLWYIANTDIVYDGMFALFGDEDQANVGTHQTSLVALTSQGDFYNDHTLNRFWTYSTTNPSTDTQILIPTDTDKYAISATGVDNLTITDLTFKYYGQNAIRLTDCNNVDVLNNTLKYGGGNQARGATGYGGGGMVFHGDFIGLDVLYNTIFQNHDAAIGPHNYAADKVARDITIGYNDISYCGGGISAHTNISATNSVVSGVTIKNNTLSSIGDGWSGLLASAEGRGIKTNNTAASIGGVMEQVIIADNTIDGAYWRGIQLFNISGDENEVSNNIVTDVKNSASGDGGSIEIDGSSNNCAGEVFSNTVYDNEQHGLLIENNAAIVNVFDNVFYNNGSVTQENVRFQNSSLNTFDDNVVYSADNVVIRDAGPYFTGDNNQYWRASEGDTYQHGAVLSDDIATWRTATGQDANGSDYEPIFLNPSKGDFAQITNFGWSNVE